MISRHRFWLILALVFSATSSRAQSCSGGVPCAVGWSQVSGSSIQSVAPSYSDILGSTGTKAIVSAWGTMAVDTKRNRLVFENGGHSDYFGNGIIGSDWNNPTSGHPTAVLIRDATHGSSLSAPAACAESNADGTPNARHDQSGFLYLPTTDEYWWYGYGLASCGNFSDGQWAYSPANNTWTRLDTTQTGSRPTTASNGSVPIMAYDPVSDQIYFYEDIASNFWSYSRSANHWTLLKTAGSVFGCIANEGNAVIDPVNRYYVCSGNGYLRKISLNPPFNSTDDSGVASCSAWVGSSINGPGMAFDPIQNKIVVWIGGNKVYTYDAAADTCATVTPSGSGPPVPTTAQNANGQQSQGTYNRFSYVSWLGGFVVLNDITQDFWFLRLTDPATAALSDFNNRVAQSSATASENFDSSTLYHAVTSGPGFWASTETNPTPANPLAVQDAAVARSGVSSAEFIIPGLSGDRPAGFYAKGYGFNLTSNSDVYFQFAQRMDAAYIADAAPAVGGGTTFWKQFITNWWDGVNNFQSCANPDLVAVNAFNEGYPFLYTQCGNAGLQLNSSLAAHGLFNEYNAALVKSGSFNAGSPANSGGTLTGGLLNGSLYNCPYASAQPNPNCFDYPPNVWQTYLVHIHMGTFSTATSLVEAWVSTPSSPAYQQFVYAPNYTFTQDGANVFNVLQLLPYWTNRDGTVCSTPCSTAHTWYDELIISHNFIPAPQTPPATSSASVQGPPSAAFSLQAGSH